MLTYCKQQFRARKRVLPDCEEEAVYLGGTFHLVVSTPVSPWTKQPDINNKQYFFQSSGHRSPLQLPGAANDCTESPSELHH
jgi:hypothetical protein